MSSDSSPETLVQEWMSRNVITVQAQDTVHDCLAKLRAHRIAALPVTDSEGQFVGIVTIGDLLRTVISTDETLQAEYPHFDDCLWAVDMILRKLGSDPVSAVMTEVVATATPEQSMCDAARTLYGLGIHHLPVIDSSGQLAGILSSMDFVKLVSDRKFPF